MRRRCVLLPAIGALLVLAAAPAYAHGDMQGTSPEDGSTVGEVPAEISITLTEPPTRGAQASATDGCKAKVPAAVSVEGDAILLTPGGGEPGKWKVKYRAVSSVDGHQTRGSVSFTVSGKKDCSADDPAESPGDVIDAADNPGILDNPNPPDEGSSWLFWVAGGTVALVALAFVIRRSSR